jgi:hypothetical protein
MKKAAGHPGGRDERDVRVSAVEGLKTSGQIRPTTIARMKENDTQTVATFNRLVQSRFDVGFMAAPCPNGMSG